MKKETLDKLKIVGIIIAALVALWFVFDQLILDEDCGEINDTEDDYEDFYDEDLD